MLSVGYARPHHVEPGRPLAARDLRRARRRRVPQRQPPRRDLAGRAHRRADRLPQPRRAAREPAARDRARGARAASRTSRSILIDLDDFKQVNEEHGHLVGDEVLRRVGHALRSGTRPYDIAARYGGDEFALIAVESRRGAGARDRRARTIARVAAGDRRVRRGQRGRRHRRRRRVDRRAHRHQLIARADRALLHGKQAGGRGEANPFSDPARARLAARPLRVALRRPLPPPPVPPAWPDTRDEARRAAAQAHAPARRSPTRSAPASPP